MPTLSPMQLQRTALRLLATLLVVGHACVALLTALHGLHVEHVRCAEHGELVHVHADEHEGGASASAESDDTGRGVDAGNPLASHAHDHCRVVILREHGDDDGLAIVPARALVQPTAPATSTLIAAQAPLGTVAITGPPLLARAPKTSPPHSA